MVIPPESLTAPQRTQVEGLGAGTQPEPAIHAFNISVEPPSLGDARGDAERLLGAMQSQHGLACESIDLHVLRDLPPRLRQYAWCCQAVVRGGKVIGVGPTAGRLFGLAVDLGTTKIAGYLVDLGTGETRASLGMMNPQIECGEDVITRASFATRPDGRQRLQEMATGALNRLVADLCGQAGARSEDIADAVIVGNTAMHHMLLGLPVAQLVVSPFAPAITHAMDLKARDIGLHIASAASVHLPPNIAGFVGADHVAMLLASGAAEEPGPLLALDVGTNTEVSLVHGGRIASVSCASGPALEGGHIKDGMRAAPGAIERVRILNQGSQPASVQYQTVDDAPPVGICGSGILDALAQLRNAGLLSPEGRLTAEHPLIRGEGRQRGFLLAEGAEPGRQAITLTQKDVREVQLAKAAIRSGIQALMEGAGCREEDICQVIIAGAFGSYIDVASAIDIGMLPVLPPDRFRQVGNAAGAGARLALLSVPQRAAAQSIASRVRYLELAGTRHFMETFVEASYLVRYRLRGGSRAAV